MFDPSCLVKKASCTTLLVVVREQQYNETRSFSKGDRMKQELLLEDRGRSKDILQRGLKMRNVFSSEDVGEPGVIHFKGCGRMRENQSPKDWSQIELKSSRSAEQLEA